MGPIPAAITPYIAATPVWIYTATIKNILNAISTESCVPSSSGSLDTTAIIPDSNSKPIWENIFSFKEMWNRALKKNDNVPPNDECSGTNNFSGGED